MATAEDVVSILTTQTREGKINWEATDWDSDGAPSKWHTATSPGECGFFLLAGSPRLDVLQGRRWVTLVHGEEIRELVGTVASLSEQKGSTREEALEAALKCLQGEGHS